MDNLNNSMDQPFLVGEACLLTYRFSTNPAPLQTSTVQSTAAAVINLGVFRENSSIYCSAIDIAVPIGAASTDLSEKTPSPSVNTGKWTVNSTVIVTGRELGLDDEGNYAVFSFQCREASDYDLDYNLVLGLEVMVNQLPGNFEYLIREKSGTTNNPNQFTPKSNSFVLMKSPPQFYLQNFITTAAESPTVPVTSFANGSSIRFAWESSGTFFQLFQSGRTEPVYSGTATTCTLQNGVHTDTTFVLVASVTANPGQDSPAGGYEPIYLYDAITVTINNPDLTPNTLKAAGNIASGGQIHGNSLVVDSTSVLTGAVTVGDPNHPAMVTVNGSGYVGGTWDVRGSSTTRNLTVSGTLSVSGGTVLENVNANVISAAQVSAVGSLTAAGLSTSGYAQSYGLTTNGGPVYVNNVGNNNGLRVFNNSSQYYCAGFTNSAQRKDNYITGIISRVHNSKDYGFGTNGRCVSLSSSALQTHLPTRHGYKVVTSPLSPYAEVHLNGTGRLENGKAVIWIGEQESDMVFHAEEATYRVLLTPTEGCNGLFVSSKAQDCFTVEELGQGRSSAEFDWFLISRKPEGLGSGIMEALPEELPQMADGTEPEGITS
ncbi:hypothetical protein [Paenibacillus sp. J22TS3]|uniref:hypothetical protein n=1 Tax=Paenibacillus sp. J22TS3 TaxID=2807192 RepID=UPI001B282F6A|nr:hypothetical protein [Paenibacillus sp. J22TS3]GIP23379.1 hypothetical protein J22TS3_36540 [Paenibacillus sp. J22TS3]